MVTEEEEMAGITSLAEVDHHHAVLRCFHEALDVAAHNDFLPVGQIAHEHRILDARAGSVCAVVLAVCRWRVAGKARLPSGVF